MKTECNVGMDCKVMKESEGHPDPKTDHDHDPDHDPDPDPDPHPEAADSEHGDSDADTVILPVSAGSMLRDFMTPERDDSERTSDIFSSPFSIPSDFPADPAVFSASVRPKKSTSAPATPRRRTKDTGKPCKKKRRRQSTDEKWTTNGEARQASPDSGGAGMESLKDRERR